MRKLYSIIMLWAAAAAGAATFDLPDVTIDTPWKSRAFASGGGETVKITFTAEGSGKADGVLTTNSSISLKFAVTPGKNSHSLTFPDSKVPIRMFIVKLAPQEGSRFVIKNFRVEIPDKIRCGNFEKVGATPQGGWVADKSGSFKIIDGKALADLSGKPLVWIKQWVPLPPNKIFTIAADVEAKNFKGCAGFELVFRGGGKGIDKTIRHMPVTKDTNGVRRLYYTFKTPAKLNYCAMRLAAMNATGTLTFDNVELLPGNFVPQVPVTKDFSSKLTLEGFFKYNRSGFKRETAPPLTEVSLATDNNELMISGICREPLMTRLKADKNNSAGFYANDNVEVFIDSQGIGRECYQIIVAPHGEYQTYFNGDSSWKDAEVKTQINEKDWRFEIKIPYEKMGYGQAEAQLSGKRLAVAFFRNRRTTGECYTMPYWNRIGFRHPAFFFRVTTGKHSKSVVIDPLYAASDSTAHTEPPMAWRTPDPLFKELMSDEKLYPGNELTGYFYNGFVEYGNVSRRPVTLFGLHHGMSFNYFRDVVSHYRASRTAGGITHYRPTGADPAEKVFAARMNRKYKNRLLFDTNLSRCDGIFAQKSAAPAYRRVFHFWGDPRSAEQKEKQIDAVLKRWPDLVGIVRLGHEDDAQPNVRYMEIRSAYLAQEPDTWKKWEEEAKREFGGGKTGFPKAELKDATPVERLVWLRFARKMYIAGLDQVIKFIRKNHPHVKISSCVGGPFPYAFGYDAFFGRFDWVTTQTLWGGGSGRQDVGFLTKYLTDISGVPAAPCVHIEAYFVSLDPTDTREVLSQVFRAGGNSFQMALFDWFGNSQSDLFGAPDRFHEVMHVLRQLPKMNKLKYPKADCAVFSSNMDRLATHYFSHEPDKSGLKELFTMLGPCNRSWFHFITEENISRRDRRLEDYKVIYIPPVFYQDDDTVQALLDYVRKGGNLVIFNTETFKFRHDGSERTPLKPGKLGAGEIVLQKTALNEAVYADSKAPLRFADLQKKFGCKTGHDIWRFTFPPGPVHKFFPENLVCLTGNACRWQRNIPTDGPNKPVKFSVAWQNKPDYVTDKGDNLFNRKAALSSKLIQGGGLDWQKELSRWAVAWKNTEPAEITLKFIHPVTVSMVKLFLHGGYQDIVVSNAGKRLADFKRSPGGEPEVDVDEVMISFKPQKLQEITVRLEKRTGITWLSELEIWGETDKNPFFPTCDTANRPGIGKVRRQGQGPTEAASKSIRQTETAVDLVSVPHDKSAPDGQFFAEFHEAERDGGSRLAQKSGFFITEAVTGFLLEPQAGVDFARPLKFLQFGKGISRAAGGRSGLRFSPAFPPLCGSPAKRHQGLQSGDDHDDPNELGILQFTSPQEFIGLFRVFQNGTPCRRPGKIGKQLIEDLRT
ncbi:MAG: hypothetical protein IJU70_11585 [Lentisphaeria bacterium]|nr:hypothetical protein [Lentisphaeria bacterium]